MSKVNQPWESFVFVPFIFRKYLTWAEFPVRKQWQKWVITPDHQAMFRQPDCFFKGVLLWCLLLCSEISPWKARLLRKAEKLSQSTPAVLLDFAPQPSFPSFPHSAWAVHPLRHGLLVSGPCGSLRTSLLWLHPRLLPPAPPFWLGLCFFFHVIEDFPFILVSEAS